MNQTTADILEWIDNNTLVGFGNKYVAVHELKYFLQHSLVSEPVVMNKDKILAEIAELFEPKWGYNTKEQWLKLVADILTAHEKKTTHSKSEYRRLKAQGVDVLPPEEPSYKKRDKAYWKDIEDKQT